MGVKRYRSKGTIFWRIDEQLTRPDGTVQRFRKRRIPTKELAMSILAQARAQIFEDGYLGREEPSTLTVAEAWDKYEPTSARDNSSWREDRARSRTLLSQLGSRRCVGLSLRDIDQYRNRRFSQTTRRGGPPSPATLDREVELLKRVLNYAVACGWLESSPIAGVKLLRKPNVRRSVLNEKEFADLVQAADPKLRPILIVAYDTGMRKREILDLRWSQVDLKARLIRLAPQDTKCDGHRAVYLTERVITAIRQLPRHLRNDDVFINSRTGKPWVDISDMFQRARKKAGMEHVWFHDLRRSFVTNARRRGIAESVVMKMSGHKTRAVFDRYNIVCEEDLINALRRMELAIEVESAETMSVEKKVN